MFPHVLRKSRVNESPDDRKEKLALPWEDARNPSWKVARDGERADALPTTGGPLRHRRRLCRNGFALAGLGTEKGKPAR